MKLLFKVTLFLAANLFLINVSFAGDIEDIRKITIKHFETQNAQDAKAHIAHHMPYHTTFSNGGLLIVRQSREEQIKSFNDRVAGKINLNLAHLEVKVYDKTAIVTGYVVGSGTNKEGKPFKVRAQRTAVLIKQGSDWKEVHVHISPITAAQ